MNTKILELLHSYHSPSPETSFVKIFRDFNRLDAIENKHSIETAYKYENFADNFERFLRDVNQPNLPISGLSMRVMKAFVMWLPEGLKSCNKTHISKHVYRINKAADYAVITGYIPFNPCAAYKVRRGKNKEVVSLDDKEFLAWTGAKWQTKVYQDAQDNWVFQMVTGLGYTDLFTYKTAHDPGTGLWIFGMRGKTGKPYHVPLYHPDFELALRIHEKHNGQLPHIENGFYNRLIREMAAMLGIEKYLTSHIGRKTFATLKDQQGFSTPVISTILGNSESVCRIHYIAPSRKKIEGELRRLRPAVQIGENTYPAA